MWDECDECVIDLDFRVTANPVGDVTVSVPLAHCYLELCQMYVYVCFTT